MITNKENARPKTYLFFSMPLETKEKKEEKKDKKKRRYEKKKKKDKKRKKISEWCHLNIIENST
ncbi:hypothetical protein V1477_019950 [Vespula maculifrons]|uniref:Uncharacterized protein n=1 Tax=Vespula maculifrons TaxID=7453 RepID=A0ABD2ANC3_VESMC